MRRAVAALAVTRSASMTDHRFLNPTQIMAAGFLLAAFLITAGWPSQPAAAATLKTAPDKYVRIANYYLKAGTDITAADYPRLAQYDLLIFPAEAQVYNQAMFPALRRLNPDILILAYVPSKSWNYGWVDSLHAKLRSGIQDSWWLRDPNGQNVSVWPGTAVISTVSGWQSYLPQFVDEEIMSTGLWDGVFYDEFSGTISWANGGQIDLQGDGQADQPYLMDVAWERATINLLRHTRDRLGPDALIVTNGDSDPDLQPFVNGRMFESFPTPWHGDGSWQASVDSYLTLENQVGYPAAMVINGNTGNTGQNANWRQVRYGLCSTLLGDGFFTYDFGETDHGQIWEYDEMKVNLGQPLNDPVNLTGGQWVQPGLWRRDFENGVSLVNSTGVVQSTELEIEMERLSGTQDPAVNDGRISTSVAIPPKDGLILLRPLDRLVGAMFPNGAFARVFDKRGGQVRNGFFAYVRPYRGSSTLLLEDFDGDGVIDTAIGDQGQLLIDRGNGQQAEIYPYGEDYRGSLSLAAADFDQDGELEIAVGPGPGLEPLVRIFDYNAQVDGIEFYAYARHFKGGINLSAANLYGTGWPVIIAGAGPTGGPHVRVFNRWGQVTLQFMAYDWAFRGGVNVTVGDFDGDGTVELATGAGPGGGPHVRIFTRYGRPWNPGFFAADEASRTGVVVAAHDTNNDGIDEIITLTTDIFRLSLQN
jgi:hypothetical protein